MTRSSKRTKTRPDDWPGGQNVLVYMVQKLLTPSRLPDAPWTLTVTKGELGRLEWPPTDSGNEVVDRVLIEDNEAFLRELKDEVNEGPRSARARGGELQGVMRALAKVMTEQERLFWKRHEHDNVTEQDGW